MPGNFSREELSVSDDFKDNDGSWDPGQGLQTEEYEVNADVSSPAEAIWAYLHGELSKEERLSFEKELACDDTLRSRFEESRQLDRLLRSVAPSLDSTDESLDVLAEQALAAWEREQAVSSRPRSDLSLAAPVRSGWLLMFRRPAMGLAGLAAAAALLLIVSPVLRMPHGVSWSDPVFAPLTLRGMGTQGGRRAMDAGSAMRCQQALKAALTRSVQARGVALPNGLSFSLRLQELTDGAFSVSVQARLRDGRTAGEWSGDYSSLQAFLNCADISAERMVELLVSLSGAGGGRS